MKHQTKWIVSLLAAAIGIVPGAASADDESYFTLSAGYESSSGKYGTTSTTDIVTIPLSALYESGPWSLKLTVPYLKITGEGDIIGSGTYRGWRGGSTTTVTTVTKTRTTQSGLGDVVTMLTYNVYSDDESGSGLDLSGRIKFGTASTALGTGKNDYAVQFVAYRGVGDFTPFIKAGYEVLGSSTQLQLNNIYYGSLGSSYSFGEEVSVGAEYKYAQKASATIADQRELNLYTDIQIGTDVYLHGYLLKGYSSGSPDTGYGLSLAVVF